MRLVGQVTVGLLALLVLGLGLVLLAAGVKSGVVAVLVGAAVVVWAVGAS